MHPSAVKPKSQLARAGSDTDPLSNNIHERQLRVLIINQYDAWRRCNTQHTIVARRDQKRFLGVIWAHSIWR